MVWGRISGWRDVNKFVSDILGDENLDGFEPEVIDDGLLATLEHDTLACPCEQCVGREESRKEWLPEEFASNMPEYIQDILAEREKGHIARRMKCRAKDQGMAKLRVAEFVRKHSQGVETAERAGTAVNAADGAARFGEREGIKVIQIIKRQLTPPLKWPGGKHYLATDVIDLMPLHTHYVEPYFGGGAVLLAKNPEGVSEVVNDLNGDLTNFWRVLQDEADFEQFARTMSAMPFSQAEWNRACESRADARGESCCFFHCLSAVEGRANGFVARCRGTALGVR